MLAWMYFKGKGVPQDYTITAHWLRLAAQSDPRAQVDLGSLYEQGKGVPLDYVTAYMWYKTAESRGERRAQEELKRLSRLMTTQQINQANAAAQDLASSLPKGMAVDPSQTIGDAFIPRP